jgi:hypothetical protein
MKKLGMEQLDEHDIARAVTARQAYIAWRMADLPAVYIMLMPTTANLKSLWMAERSIRAQVAEDQALLSSPWRKLGRPSHVFDQSGMSADELVKFGVEVSIPAGLTDAPKPGMANHPDVVAAQERARASTPEGQRGNRIASAYAAMTAAQEAYVAGQRKGVDAAKLEKLAAALTAAREGVAAASK